MIVPPDRAVATVFCAVWSGDPQRHALLEGHQACLDAQDVPVAALYVFDDGDEPPPWLRGEHIVSPDPLTIYQAWNVAVQMTTTEFVMNLNLDDRLQVEAVGLLAGMIGANSALALVGAEWEVCYTQAETDEDMGHLRPGHAVPFVPGWPPDGSPTRLGSGTGHRGTLGPATMWRTALHDRMTYPWQFRDGELIRSIGDMAWWSVVQTLGQGIARMPVIIGRYHSHPGDQAEFRVDDESDRLSSGVRREPYPVTKMRRLSRY